MSSDKKNLFAKVKQAPKSMADRLGDATQSVGTGFKIGGALTLVGAAIKAAVAGHIDMGSLALGSAGIAAYVGGDMLCNAGASRKTNRLKQDVAEDRPDLSEEQLQATVAVGLAELAKQGGEAKDEQGRRLKTVEEYQKATDPKTFNVDELHRLLKESDMDYLADELAGGFKFVERCRGVQIIHEEENKTAPPVKKAASVEEPTGGKKTFDAEEVQEMLEKASNVAVAQYIAETENSQKEPKQ